MQKTNFPKHITAWLIFGRPPLVFMGMVWAVATIITKNPICYMLGVLCLFSTIIIDLIDGWFAARFGQSYKLAHLAERTMNKIVYSIIFPLVSVGMMWRFHFVSATNSKVELLHVVFVLFLCIIVLIRENFAHFMRNFALKKGEEEEMAEITRLRTIVAGPVAAILYAHAFYVPQGPSHQIYFWISWLGNIPLRFLFFIEIVFFVINLGSIAGYCRRYGNLCLDELCMDDDLLRRRILSIFPNALTVMNALMGTLSVFFAYNDRMLEAFMFIIGAAVFDRLDGAVARKLGLSDPIPDTNNKRIATFGAVLDDIADAVSFCIAPAFIFYFLFAGCTIPAIQHLPYGWISCLYAAMGIARLIYFTLDKKPIPGFFKGMPTPAAALLITSPLIIFQDYMQMLDITPSYAQFWGYFCCVLIIIVSILMNTYPIKYIHMGRFAGRHPVFARFMFLSNGVMVFTPYFGHFNLCLLLFYAFSPLITWLIKPEDAARER